MNVSQQVLRFTALILLSWVVMILTHEAGHILGGWCSGGTLVDFDLIPWHLPYSLFAPDPLPLVTLWSGPILGAAVPYAVALYSRRESTQLVAYFCVLANGIYITVAWFAGDSELDTTKLLSHGAHPASIAAYCLVTVGVGYVGFRKCCVSCFQAKPSCLQMY